MKTRLAALLAAASRSKLVLVATVGIVVLAVAGATYGYSAMGTTVTLSVDGEERQVRADADTVAEVLEAEGIEVGERDLVQPDLDEAVDEGTKIAVRYSRPVELTVDGETKTHWVTATSVNAALDQIGSLYRDARLSTSRGTTIERGGLSLEVVTEKKLTVSLAGKKPVTKQVAALTVEDALEALDVKIDKHDVVRPGLKKEVDDGDKVAYVDFEVKRKKVKGESYTVDQVVRENDDELEGTETVVREGEPGVRDVVYRVVYRNGEQISQRIVSSNVVEKAVPEVVEVGTKEEPTANFAGGSTVWDALAQCESGGNWAINTGNGYYGGLQFSLSTWRAYGGPGYPHQQSRETQIMIAERVRAATGGYGSWPHCSAQLGLPQ